MLMLRRSKERKRKRKKKSGRGMEKRGGRGSMIGRSCHGS